MTYCLMIDFNMYAGDFERELCAFITGQVNPNTVLLDEAEMYLKKYPLNEKVIVNENNRVVELSYSSNKWDNGSGYVYRVGDEESALAHYKKYMDEYLSKATSVLNRDRVFMGEESYLEEMESLILQHSDAMKLTEPIKSRVKNSVVIYFSEEITDEEFVFFIDRVLEFCLYYDEGVLAEAIFFLSEQGEVIKQHFYV